MGFCQNNQTQFKIEFNQVYFFLVCFFSVVVLLYRCSNIGSR